MTQSRISRPAATRAAPAGAAPAAPGAAPTAPGAAPEPWPRPGTPAFESFVRARGLTPAQRTHLIRAYGPDPLDTPAPAPHPCPADADAAPAADTAADAKAVAEIDAAREGSPPAPAAPAPDRSASEMPAPEMPTRRTARSGPAGSRADGWSPAVQRRFLEVLAQTGCVSHACRAVGRSRTSAYALRARTDARPFAEAWEEALRQACRALTDTLWERAMLGQEEIVTGADGAVRTARRRHDNRLAMWLLAHHDPVLYGRLANAPAPLQLSRSADSRRFPALLNTIVRAPVRALSRLRP